MRALLRCENPGTGTTKDWEIEETPAGFTTRWGRTPQLNQTKEFPKKRYPGGIFAEIHRRIKAQLRQGYRYVGNRVPAGCPPGPLWDVAPVATAPPPKPPPKAPPKENAKGSNDPGEPKKPPTPARPAWDASQAPPFFL